MNVPPEIDSGVASPTRFDRLNEGMRLILDAPCYPSTEHEQMNE